MIEKFQTENGRTYWRMPHQDLKVLTEWVQAMLHVIHGTEEGEKKFKNFRLQDALELWSNQTQTEQ